MMRVINRTLETRFRALLEEDRGKRCIVLTKRKKINLTHYAWRLGCIHSTLSQFTELIREFEGAVRSFAAGEASEECRRQFARLEASPMGVKLRGLIESDLASGKLVTSRGGKISRAHYAARFEVTPSNMIRFAFLFERFEREHEVVTGPEARLGEMRDWLSAAYDSRELSLRDGKVDRKAFQVRFKLKGGSFINRSDKVRALF